MQKQTTKLNLNELEDEQHAICILKSCVLICRETYLCKVATASLVLI